MGILSWNAMRTPTTFSVAAVFSCLCGSLTAALGAVDVSMTFGRIGAEGFPGPTSSLDGTTGSRSVSGGGSTGGGLGGSGDLLVSITDDTFLNGGDATRLRVTGDCEHLVEFGYTAVRTIDDDDGYWHIVMQLEEPAIFSVVNASTAAATNGGARLPIQPVEFTAITGSITGSVAAGGSLSPGTYVVKVWLGGYTPSGFNFCRMPSGYSNFASSGVHDAVADWSLVLAPIPTCIATDLDCNGLVDGGDIAFALLDFGPCAGCPSDVDGTGVVDFGDVALIMLDFG